MFDLDILKRANEKAKNLQLKGESLGEFHISQDQVEVAAVKIAARVCDLYLLIYPNKTPADFHSEIFTPVLRSNNTIGVNTFESVIIIIMDSKEYEQFLILALEKMLKALSVAGMAFDFEKECSSGSKMIIEAIALLREAEMIIKSQLIINAEKSDKASQNGEKKFKHWQPLRSKAYDEGGNPIYRTMTRATAAKKVHPFIEELAKRLHITDWQIRDLEKQLRDVSRWFNELEFAGDPRGIKKGKNKS